MKKDIHIPKVEDIFVAVVQEQHPEFKTDASSVYQLFQFLHAFETL